MKILIMEKNLLLASKIKNSLAGLDVRVGEEKGGSKVIAYCGHKRTDLIQKAKENGADLVVPNSKIVDARSLIEG
ncbi:hypothetical protein [Thermocrinis sp.]|uniref:hypothetical protein n=1 Tax=Thermocrinis sp. TaxID=2024383 RepID=UPI002FDEB705